MEVRTLNEQRPVSRSVVSAQMASVLNVVYVMSSLLAKFCTRLCAYLSRERLGPTVLVSSFDFAPSQPCKVLVKRHALAASRTSRKTRERSVHDDLTTLCIVLLRFCNNVQQTHSIDSTPAAGWWKHWLSSPLMTSLRPAPCASASDVSTSAKTEQDSCVAKKR